MTFTNADVCFSVCVCVYVCAVLQFTQQIKKYKCQMTDLIFLLSYVSVPICEEGFMCICSICVCVCFMCHVCVCLCVFVQA